MRFTPAHLEAHTNQFINFLLGRQVPDYPLVIPSGLGEFWEQAGRVFCRLERFGLQLRLDTCRFPNRYEELVTQLKFLVDQPGGFELLSLYLHPEEERDVRKLTFDPEGEREFRQRSNAYLPKHILTAIEQNARLLYLPKPTLG